MAVVNRGVGGGSQPHPSGGVPRSYSNRSDRLKKLRRQQSSNNQKSSCLSVVLIFFILVVIAVMATVQTTTTLDNKINSNSIDPGKNNAGGIRKKRSPEQQQQQDQQRQLNDQPGGRYTEEGEEGNTKDNTEEDAADRFLDEPLLDSNTDINDETLAREAKRVADHKLEAKNAIKADIEAIEEELIAIDSEVKNSTEEKPTLTTEESVKEEPVVQPEINFCEKTPSPDPEHGYSNPALVVLGMEDTSAELLWQVAQQILYPNHRTHRGQELTDLASAVNFGELGKPELVYHNNFWKKVPETSHGKWIPDVFCQQQELGLPPGFTWLSSPNYISNNEKAQETLQLIKDDMPSQSVKIIRIRRNYLDVLIRHAQVVSTGTQDATVLLDRKKVLAKLGKLQNEQDAVDNYLKENDIPVLEVAFEALFPFDHWTDMVQVAQTTRKTQNNILEGPSLLWPSSSELESAWREVLQFLGVTQPITMFNVLQKVMQTHKVHSFWIQKDAVSNYAHLEQTLLSTHFGSTLRRQELNLEDWGEGDEM